MGTRLKTFLCSSIFSLLFSFVLTTSNSQALAGTSIALPGWKWRDIAGNMGAIQAAGYTAILLSPHTATCSGAFGGQGYDPSDLASFDGGFGNTGELQNLINTAHAHGVQVYANMVMNHMCTKSDYSYDRFGWNDFHHNGCIQNWSDTWSLENQDMFGLNDLAQESAYVRGELWKYLVKTNNMGFDGYRWDGAKHVPRWYWNEHVVNNVNAWGKFNFGEVYDANLSVLQSYADTGMAVTDYNLYDAMYKAFDFGGDLSVLDGVGYAQRDGFKAVTFVENHDVGAPVNRLLAYAFIATYPGYPMFTNVSLNDTTMNNLVWINKNLARGVYINRWKEKDIFAFERQGNLLVGINQSKGWQTRWVSTSWSSRQLHDYAGRTNNIWTAADGRVAISIPPMSYVMLAP